jgi:hypothetical protein
MQRTFHRGQTGLDTRALAKRFHELRGRRVRMLGDELAQLFGHRAADRRHPSAPTPPRRDTSGLAVEPKDAAHAGHANVQNAGDLLVREALFVEGAHDGSPNLLGMRSADPHSLCRSDSNDRVKRAVG